MNNKINTYYLVQSMFVLIDVLVHKRLSIKEISKEIEVSPRTLYRQFKILEEMGYAVDKDFKNKYFIAMDVCPICKRETKIEVNEQMETA